MGLALALLVFAAVIARKESQNRHSAERETLEERLDTLQGALGRDPVPPSAAVLISRTEFLGDLVSDGPAIEWKYTFGGTSAEFVEHYRSTLASQGWTEQPPGNVPGQLANFGRRTEGGDVLIVIFAASTRDIFEVYAS